MRILVSACLLGAATRYDGGSSPNPRILALLKEHTLIPVCPEQLGGLPTPRLPCEQQYGRVVRSDGGDATEPYLRGALEASRLCGLLKCDCAILKARSPMCGCGRIYDGTFTHTLVQGDGILAKRLKETGIPVGTDEDERLPGSDL